MNRKRVEELIRELITELGEDPQREGLMRTPQRIAGAYEFLTSGYRVDIDKMINGAIFTQIDNTQNMIIARDIELYSLCEHHMLPFFGQFVKEAAPITVVSLIISTVFLLLAY